MISGKLFLAPHCFQVGTFKLKSTLTDEFKFTDLPFWIYLQMHSYHTTHKSKNVFNRPLTTFETLCFKGERTDRTISQSYAWLQQNADQHVGPRNLQTNAGDAGNHEAQCSTYGGTVHISLHIGHKSKN